MGSPTHLNASLSLSWWNGGGCVGLASIDFDSMRWCTGNDECVLTAGVLVGDEATCDVDAHDEFGVTELWFMLSEFDVAGVDGDASESEPCGRFDFPFGLDFDDGFPLLEISLAFECSSSRSLPPLSSFNASAASNDLRCMPILILTSIGERKKNISNLIFGFHFSYYFFPSTKQIVQH